MSARTKYLLAICVAGFAAGCAFNSPQSIWSSLESSGDGERLGIMFPTLRDEPVIAIAREYLAAKGLQGQFEGADVALEYFDASSDVLR